jgi:hypothetical protein
MRTASLAVEAYNVDAGSYPLCAGVDGNPIMPYPTGGPYILGTRLSPALTSPVAYLTVLPCDVFSEDASAPPLPYFFNSRTYAFAKSGMVGLEYFDGYVRDLSGGTRTGVQYVLASNGPDCDHDLQSDSPC